MTDQLRDRIRQRLEETGKSAQQTSLEAGLSKDFLRTFFNRPNSSIRTANLAKIAEALHVSQDWLLGESDDPNGTPGKARNEAIPIRTVDQPTGRTQEHERNLPVYGLAAGAIVGQLAMTNDPIEYVKSPDALEKVRGAYALIVTGSSMEPRYVAGDVIFVNPNRPPRQGDHVVIQEATEDGTVTSIKRYEKMTDFHVVTTQYNPLTEIKFLRAQVMAVHRVLTPNEVAGV